MPEHMTVYGVLFKMEYGSIFFQQSINPADNEAKMVIIAII